MNKSNLDFIQDLTKLDRKDLVAKVGKLFEEGGELSSKALPFSNAHGTLHRMVEKKDILEEVADVMLVAMSIGYELGFSHDDIEEMMMKKANVWANLHKRESRMADKVPFEIHITIEEAEQQAFINTCKQLEVKPIILALQAKESTIKDVMTSSKLMGSNREALEEMKRISNGLSDAGFKVLREKIETVPWHTAAPSRENNNLEMPNKDCYFESHFGIKMDGTDKQRNLLEIICRDSELHLSRNAFKKNEDGTYVNMATYRKYDGVSEDFIDKVEEIFELLTQAGFSVDKPIVEFSIFDSKTSHDAEWLKK